MQNTDKDTVEALQLKAPGLSTEDLASIEISFRERKLFSSILNPESREQIWENLRKEKRLIPSLWSFFEDIKYLKGPTNIMKHLFSNVEGTVYSAMEGIFTGVNQKENEIVL